MRIQIWQKQVFWAVAFVAGLLAWFAFYHVPALIDSQTKGMSIDVSSLKTDVGNLKGEIQRVDSTMNGMMKELLDAQLASLKELKKLSTKDAKERLDFVVRITRKAKEAHVLADPRIVTEAGKNTLELVNNHELRTTAWNTIEQLSAYRSFLNIGAVPSFPDAKPTHEFSVACRILKKPAEGETGGIEVKLSGTAPRDKAALLYELSAPKFESTVEFFIVSGKNCAIILDGQRMRNVIIRDSVIEYNGGAVVLDKVYFVNCTFKMRQVPPSVKLSERVLASVSVNFSHVPS